MDRRTCATLVALTLSSLVVAGCSNSTGSSTEVGPQATDQAVTSSEASVGSFRVGDCWQEDDVAAAAQWLVWEGGDQVDCGTSHNSITFAVPLLGDDFPYSVDADGNLMEPTEAAAAMVGFACRSHAGDLLPPGAPESSMVTVAWYLPTGEQWRAGQRQVRCDLTLQAFDVNRSEPTMRPMPATLADLAIAERSDPLAYEVCALTEDGVAAGPFESPTTTKVVRCDGPHTWRWLQGTQMAAAADAPYPGDATIEAAYVSACAQSDPDQVWWAFPPTAATWAAGDRAIDCWLGKDLPAPRSA